MRNTNYDAGEILVLNPMGWYRKNRSYFMGMLFVTGNVTDCTDDDDDADDGANGANGTYQDVYSVFTGERYGYANHMFKTVSELKELAQNFRYLLTNEEFKQIFGYTYGRAGIYRPRHYVSPSDLEEFDVIQNINSIANFAKFFAEGVITNNVVIPQSIKSLINDSSFAKQLAAIVNCKIDIPESFNIVNRRESIAHKDSNGNYTVDEIPNLID